MLSLPDDDSYTQAEADDEESYAQEEDPSLTPSLPPEDEPSITLPSLPLTDSEVSKSFLSILTERNFDQSVQEMLNNSYVEIFPSLNLR